MGTTKPNHNFRISHYPRNFRILRKLLPSLGAVAFLLVSMLLLCGWSGGNDASFIMERGRPVYFVARSIPGELGPVALVGEYQCGFWDGSERNVDGVSVRICNYGSLSYRLKCQRIGIDGNRYNSYYTVILPVYPDLQVIKQDKLLTESDAACSDIVKFVKEYGDSLEKDPYKGHTTWLTKSLMVFDDENGFELYRRGKLMDAFSVKNAEKVTVFCYKGDERWRSDFVVYAAGWRYYAYDDGYELTVSATRNVVFHDWQGSFYATLVNGDELKTYEEHYGMPGKSLTGITMAKTVEIPVTGQSRTVRYLAYTQNGQMRLTESISRIWRYGTPCGHKVPYRSFAELQAAVDAGEVTYDGYHLVMVTDATKKAA